MTNQTRNIDVKHSRTNEAAAEALPGSRNGRERVIEQALDRAVLRYIASRERRVAPFVKRHFSFRGSLRLHAHALGWDLLRVPLNIVWSVPKFLFCLLGMLAGLCRLNAVAEALNRIPSGLTTDLDREIGWLVITELLEFPHRDGHRESRSDALMDEILDEPELERLMADSYRENTARHGDPAFRRQLDRMLDEYGASRTGTSELASNLVVVVSSQLALGQASFGSLSAGNAIAVAMAKSAAVSGFWLGPALGTYYYALVPVSPSFGTLLTVTLVMALLLAFVSTFIGILTDPVQAWCGLHQRRLRRLLQAVQRDLGQGAGGPFQLREKYVGRVFDVLDWLSMLGRLG